jgi:hypothetical protein
MGQFCPKWGYFALFEKVFSIEQIYKLVFQSGPFSPNWGDFAPFP